MSEDTDFIASLGKAFTAHRLRRLSELFVDAYAQWLPEFGVAAPARSMSTLLLLDREGELGVTEIAGRLRLTHPLLIRMVTALEGRGLIAVGQDAADGRRRPIRLTTKGRAEVKRVKSAMLVLERTFAELFDEIGADLATIAGRIEDACLHDGFRARIDRAAAHIESGKEVSCV